MPRLTHNGINFREANPASPELSVRPREESHLSMRGWFDWQDLVSQAASKAYLGTVAVVTGYPGADPALVYLSYTLPLIHPDWNPNNSQLYVCDGFENVRGSVPNSPSIGPNLTATFDEANTVLHFRSPKDGYRVFPDSAVVDPAFGVPREYFCLRNMGVREDTTERALTIPGLSSLEFAYTLPPAGAPGGIFGILQGFVANEVHVTESCGSITLDWYPLPLVGAFNEAAFNALVGKTNSAPFPPPPPNALRSPLTTKPAGTLVMGEPRRFFIRKGDAGIALGVTLTLSYHPYGANSFFWPSPPAAARGRIDINPTDGAPFPNPQLGGPGYYPAQRPGGGGPLFPAAPFAAAFCPPGTPAAARPAF
jgi:hypothetical protein